MLRVALTGGIASGKSTVSDALVEHGAVVIDADVLAREVVQPGTPGLAAVVERFGRDVLTVEGDLDRPRMGALVFADPDARRDLERIVHPLVRSRAEELERQAAADAVVVHVIPLLVETGRQGDFDVVVVVDLDPLTQHERLVARSRFTGEEAAARLAAQAGRGRRLAAAGLVVDNNGSPQQLADAVGRLWSELDGRSPRG